MDLLKTLLVYMTVLLTSGVSQLPALTPMPTQFQTPTPVVTISPTPVYITSTPAPVPTSTPRMTTLYVGDRGERARDAAAPKGIGLSDWRCGRHLRPADQAGGGALPVL